MKLIEKNIDCWDKSENIYTSTIIDKVINSNEMEELDKISDIIRNMFEDGILRRTPSTSTHDYEISISVPSEEDVSKTWNEIEEKLEELEELVMENETKTFKAQYEDEILDFQIEFDDLGENYSFFDENGQLQEHQSNLKKVSKIFLDKFNEIYEEFELNQFLHDLVEGESVTLKGMTFSY